MQGNRCSYYPRIIRGCSSALKLVTTDAVYRAVSLCIYREREMHIYVCVHIHIEISINLYRYIDGDLSIYPSYVYIYIYVHRGGLTLAGVSFTPCGAQG